MQGLEVRRRALRALAHHLDDLNPESSPGLKSVMSRSFGYVVAFHGFDGTEILPTLEVLEQLAATGGAVVALSIREELRTAAFARADAHATADRERPVAEELRGRSCQSPGSLISPSPILSSPGSSPQAAGAKRRVNTVRAAARRFQSGFMAGPLPGYRLG